MGSASNRLISKAKELAKAGNDQEALSLANELVAKYPTDMKVWSLRAYLHGRNRSYTDAIDDVTHAISNNPMEPSLFFDRGRYLLALGDDQSAIVDFSKGLELCDYYQDDYYREALHFMRAESFVRLGRKREALVDLSFVREDYTLWRYKLRTKAELVAECNKLPE